MKKITMIALLMTIMSYAQKKDVDDYLAVTAGVNPQNILFGSDPTNNNSALNYHIQFNIVGNNKEVYIGLEEFPTLDYSRYFVGLGYHFHLYNYTFSKEIKTTFIPSLQLSNILRHGDWGGGLTGNQFSSHASIALNLSLKYQINDLIAVQTSYNGLPRTDDAAKYGGKLKVTNSVNLEIVITLRKL
jgi:hypothetical protein